MTLSYLWLRQCALHSGCSKYWQQCLVNIQAGPLLPHSGQQECVWHLPWSERGSRPDQRISTSPGYSSIQERQTFIALTKLQSTPKSIWQLPCGLATCVANVSIVYPLLLLYTTFFARSQQPGELLIIGIVQWTGQDSHGRDTSVFEAVLFFPPYHWQ